MLGAAELAFMTKYNHPKLLGVCNQCTPSHCRRRCAPVLACGLTSMMLPLPEMPHLFAELLGVRASVSAIEPVGQGSAGCIWCLPELHLPHSRALLLLTACSSCREFVSFTHQAAKASC